MCGINGIIGPQEVDISATIQKMNNLILHRGPDNEGIYYEDGQVAMGMRRLSIIDLSTGNQPMYNDDNNIVIVFNGEIYNYKELRKRLQDNHGIVFKTKSDTEVILKGYEVWGKEVLEYLNGMFAFAIYDKSKAKVFLVRDRFGEKPLYYFKKENYFVWGSELKSVIYTYQEFFSDKPIMSKEALNLYFQLTFIPAPYTIYQGIYKLDAAHWLEVDTNSLNLQINKYWITDKPQSEEINDYQESQKKIKDILYESVEQRMVTDVPLGIFLSGGVDSSIITAIAKDLKPNDKIQTFSIGFKDKRFDESDSIRMVAKHLGVENQLFILESDQMIADIDNIIKNYDEPFADSSALPTYQVSKMTRNHVTVALTGDGGDEVFGGYNRYQMAYYAHTYRSLTPQFLHRLIKKTVNCFETFDDRKSIINKSKRFLNSLGKNEQEDQLNIIKLGFSDVELKKLMLVDIDKNTYFNEKYAQAGNFSTLKRSRFLDKSISLEGDMLVKVDRASMLVSLECRSPFLDHRLWEFTNHLPDSFLIKKGNKKRILKDTFEHLLPSFFFNLPKSGFGVPVGEWLRTSLKNELLQVTSACFLKEQAIFNEPYITILVYEHLNNVRDHTFKLWTLYCFQKWYKIANG